MSEPSPHHGGAATTSTPPDPVTFATQLHARLRFPYLTAIFFIANVALYIVTSWQSEHWLNGDRQTLTQWGALVAPLVTGGEWWRVLTASFLHAGLMHIALNMMALVDAGRLVERLYGSRNFAIIYSVSAIAASTASLWWRQDILGVGASGAIFGVYGSLIAYLVRQRGSVPLQMMRTLSLTMVIFLVFAVMAGIFIPGIDNAAHLGGFLAGIVCGLLCTTPIANPLPKFPTKLLVSAALCIAVCAATLTRLPNYAADYPRQQALLTALDHFAEEEHALVERYNVMHERRTPPNEALDILDQELIVRWQQQITTLEGMAVVQPRLERFRQDVLRYAIARRDALDLLARAIESRDTLLLEDANQKQHEADALAAAMQEQRSYGRPGAG